MLSPYYQDELATIYHGDCRELLPEIGKVGLVLTDPPYAIGARNGEWAATATVAIGLSEAAKLVARKGALVAFTTSSGRGIEFTQGSVGKTLPLNRVLTWHKDRGRSNAVSPWRWDTVAILVFGSVSADGTKAASSVFNSPADYERPTGHRAELPEGIGDWLYGPFDKPELTVLDPFVGTGRLLEPAVRAGRRVIGIDVDERSCEMATERLRAAASGLPPILRASEPSLTLEDAAHA